MESLMQSFHVIGKKKQLSGQSHTNSIQGVP